MKDYKKEKITIDLVWANLFSLFLIPPTLLIFGIPFYLIWKNNFTISELKNIKETFTPTIIANGTLGAFLVIMLGVIVHELIHGLVWAKFTKNGFKSISFGVMWKMLTPYCHCKEPLLVKHYLYGAMMPAIVLGFIPALIAILTGNLGLLVFGIFFTIVAAGDFLIMHALRKENINDFVEDHPAEAGCYIYRKIKQE